MWWRATQRLWSRSYSNSGNSRTHRNCHSPALSFTSSRPSWVRSTPSAFKVGSHGPFVNTTASPLLAFTRSKNWSSSSPGKITCCLSRSESCTLKNVSPPAPPAFTTSSYLRSWVPEISAPPAITIAAAVPPGILAPFAITLRGERAHRSVTSTNSRPNRTSGLSLPNRPIDSRNVSRGNGSLSSTPRHSRHMAANRPSTAAKTSFSVTKLISRSICVCSGWRSARRSSSRRQRASWK